MGHRCSLQKRCMRVTVRARRRRVDEAQCRCARLHQPCGAAAERSVALCGRSTPRRGTWKMRPMPKTSCRTAHDVPGAQHPQRCDRGAANLVGNLASASQRRTVRSVGSRTPAQGKPMPRAVAASAIAVGNRSVLARARRHRSESAGQSPAPVSGTAVLVTRQADSAQASDHLEAPGIRPAPAPRRPALPESSPVHRGVPRPV